MGFIETVKRLDYIRIAWTILILVPYVDKEVVAILPGIRQVTPGVTPIYVTQLTWTERGRLAVLVVVPYIDGEVLSLGGIEVEEAIADP